MKQLLVAVDFSEVTARLVAEVRELARALPAGVRLVHVAAPDPEFVGYEADPPALRDQHAREYREEHRQLQALADELRGAGVDCKALLVRGPTVEKILEEAGHGPADLLALGSHGHGALHRALLGSVSEGIVRAAPCPVLIVPARES